MKQIKLDDLAFEMLKDLSKRKDSLGITATLTEWIREEIGRASCRERV